MGWPPGPEARWLCRLEHEGASLNACCVVHVFVRSKCGSKKKRERERKRNIFSRKERERVKGPEAHRRYHRLCTPAGRCACTEPLASNDERSADVRARPRSAISAASRLPSLPGHASRSACPNRATLVPNRQCERRAFSSLNTRRALVASGCRRPSRSLGRPCSDTFPRSGNRERERKRKGNRSYATREDQ